MSEQLEFFKPVRSQPVTNSLFLAVIPDRNTARRLSDLGDALRSRLDLAGRVRPLDHLHLTLHWFGDHAQVPDRLVQAVGHACEAVVGRVSSFEVSLDRVVSFRARPGNYPLVVTGKDEGVAALMSFHQVLLTELAKHGCLDKRNPPFKPHVTLLYDRQNLAEASIDALSWRVEEIVLVCSEVGNTKHHHLGRWKLGA